MYPFEQWLEQASNHYLATRRPLVSLCYAQSLDGSLAARRGQPMLLSGLPASQLTHRLRSLHEGILVGVGTVLADDPQLSVRLANGPNPQPIILDSRLRIPLSARLLQPEQTAPKPWIVTTGPVNSKRAEELEAAGARLLILPEAAGRGVNLQALLERLGGAGIKSLMVEGGAQVISSFLAHGLVDFTVITVAPCFVGGLNLLEPGSMAGGGLSPLRLKEVGFDRLGEDLIIWGRLR